MEQISGLREGALLRASLLAWLLTALLAFAVAFDPQAASAVSPLQLHGALQRDGDIGIVGHRGAADLAPENTLSAFRVSIERGADFVETDVQLTADGVPVLMHDPEVDRTTDGHGPLSRYTFDQLRSLDAGSWFAPEFAGERVPTLEEFLTLLEPAPTRAFVEIKGEWPSEKIVEVLELLRARSFSPRVVLASFEVDTLETIRAHAPEFATILLTRELDQSVVDLVTRLRVSAICARDKLLEQHPATLKKLRDAGIGTIAYTLNTKKQWKRAQAMGVDFFVTDDPPALAAWRDSRSGEGSGA